MNQKFTVNELKKIYQIIRALIDDIIVNPSEEWELDYYDEPAIDRKGLNSLLKKIEKLLPKHEVEKIKKNMMRRKYDTFRNEIDEDVYRKIEKAFNERRTVEIGYFDMNSAEIRKRKIDVYHKTSKYVTAFCHLRSAMRKFRTSRIVSAKLTNKTYSIPAHFNRKEY